jgi:hypothetical protein
VTYQADKGENTTMTDAQSMPTDAEQHEEKTIRDQTFAYMFQKNELVWRVGEHYDPIEMMWRVDFLRQSKQGTWMYERYHYDVATRVIYFMGTRPVAEEELTKLRRSGQRIRPLEPA